MPVVPAAGPGPRLPRSRSRAALLAALCLTSLAGAEGAVQLVAGVATPPTANLEPLHLSSWVLPGVWLFASVALPCGVAAWAVHRRLAAAPRLALAAAGLLALELAVQIPFVGASALQLVLGLVALAIAALGWRLRPLPSAG